MYQEFYQKSPLLAFPLIALVLFIAVFALITWRALSPKNRSRYAALSELPLERGEEGGHHGK